METEGGSIQENRYDAENLRFELLENGRETGFVYHNGELLHEEDRDEQLSTALVTGGQGELLNSYQYDAFGAELESVEQLSNRIRYTGQQYDGLTGQYYLRARYYNPVLGRFMQEDTYWGDGLNLYAYCGNNPVVYCDPSGYAKTCTRSGETKEDEQVKDCYNPDNVNPLYEDLPGEVVVPEKYNDKYDNVEEYLEANRQDSVVLREQLIEAGVPEPPFPNQAHHIAPINQAPEAIEHLAELGIDGNSVANGVFLPEFEIAGNPQAVHSFQYSNMMRHGGQYIQEINTQILSTTTKEEALSVLDFFRKGLLSGLIDYLYKD